MVAAVTRQMLEEQEKVRRLEAEVERLKVGFRGNRQGEGRWKSGEMVSTLRDVRMGAQEHSVEIDRMLDSIDRSLFAQESLNQEAISKYNPIHFVEEMLGSASIGGYCRVRKEELEQLVETYKQSKQDLTNSQILIASLKEKEQKLSTIIEQERSQNTRSIHGSPQLSDHGRRRTLGSSPGSYYGGNKDLVSELERSLAEERQNFSNLLENHRQYENEIIRLENELEKEQEYRAALSRKYNDSLTGLQDSLEEQKLQNEKLKEQYKKLYAFVNKSS